MLVSYLLNSNTFTCGILNWHLLIISGSVTHLHNDEYQSQGQNLRAKWVWGTQELSSPWWEWAPVSVPQSISHVPTQAAFPIHLMFLPTFCFQKTDSVGVCFILLLLWFLSVTSSRAAEAAWQQHSSSKCSRTREPSRSQLQLSVTGQPIACRS